MLKLSVPAPEPWPDLCDAALTATLEEWAPPWITGLVRREHFARFDLASALRSRLSYAQGAILEREAPTHFAVPSGSRIPIDYLDGEIRRCRCGCRRCSGCARLRAWRAAGCRCCLKLLSPAGRPVQITRDLVSFWNRGYHDVKKDLKGRYPKHYWPEDPYTARADAARAPAARDASLVKGGLRGRILDPLHRLLQQGVSAERLALCVAIGVVVGNIPILGTSTLLCAAIALLFRLNLPAMQIAQAAMALVAPVANFSDLTRCWRRHLIAPPGWITDGVRP